MAKVKGAGAGALEAMIEALHAAGPRQARAASVALVTRLRAEPALRSSLPSVADAPEAHRRTIASAHAAALQVSRDGEGLRALVAELDGSIAWSVVLTLGNARERAPFAVVAEHALERDEPDVRLAALYFLRHWLAAGAELAPYAPALVRAAGDERSGTAMKGKVASEARAALRDAAGRTSDHGAFVRAVEAVEDATLRRALAKLLSTGTDVKDSRGAKGSRGEKGGATAEPDRADADMPLHTVAEAVRALGGDPPRQGEGLRFLLRALVGDMADVRAAFVHLSRLLDVSEVSIRRDAALLAYYGADLQGPTDEAQAMRRALEAHREDVDATVREHVEAALRALDHARARPRRTR